MFLKEVEDLSVEVKYIQESNYDYKRLSLLKDLEAMNRSNI